MAGADKRFLANKKNDKIEVLHPSLKPYLSDSWGEMIYQEQMFAILHDLAGFSWSLVDDAKTAMTKKDAKKMAVLKDEAVQGFQSVTKIKRSLAEKIWAMIQAQSSYLFNRSHAVAYSFLTYQTARLKFDYPLEYIAALLRTVDPKSTEAKNKRATYISEALRLGFTIAPPDINVSDAKFTPSGKDTLTFGLQDIKGVGDAAIKKILNQRDTLNSGFSDANAVIAAANNSGVSNALANAGALRCFGVEPDGEKQEELLSWQFVDRLGSFRKKYADKIRPPKDNNKVFLVGEIISAERKRTKNGDSFYSWLIRWQPGEEYRITVFDSADQLFGLRKGSIVTVTGRWNTNFNNLAISEVSQARVLKLVTPAQGVAT